MVRRPNESHIALQLEHSPTCEIIMATMTACDSQFYSLICNLRPCALLPKGSSGQKAKSIEPASSERRFWNDLAKHFQLFKCHHLHDLRNIDAGLYPAYLSLIWV